MSDDTPMQPTLLLQQEAYDYIMHGLQGGFPSSPPSRSLKILRAALAIGLAHELGLGHGPLHCLIEDSNYDGDLSSNREQIEIDVANGRCSEAERQAAHACIDSLEALSDDERFAAEWLYLRTLRWDTWNIDEEPQ